MSGGGVSKFGFLTLSFNNFETKRPLMMKFTMDM